MGPSGPMVSAVDKIHVRKENIVAPIVKLPASKAKTDVSKAVQ